MASPVLDAQTEATMATFKEFLLTYNKLSENCFVDCVHDFNTRKVLDSEDSCAKNCMDKYMKVTQRLSQTFSELQMRSTAEEQSLLNNIK